MAIESIIAGIEKECNISIKNYTKIDEGANYDIYKIVSDKAEFTLRHQTRAMYNFAPSEAENLKLLNGFHAPKLYFYQENFCGDSPVMLLDYIEGTVPVVTDDIIKKIISQCEEIHVKYTREPKFITKSEYLLEIFNEKFSCLFTKLNGNPYLSVDTLLPYIEKVRNRILHLSHIKVEKECLVHLDLHPKNLLINGDTLTFLDWELSRFSIEELEFAAILFAYGRKSDEDFQRVLTMIPSEKRELSKLAYDLRTLDVVVWRAVWVNENRDHENCKMFLDDLEAEMKMIERF